MKQTEWDHNTEHLLPEYFEECGINSYTWTKGLESSYAATETEGINFMQKHLTVTLRRSNYNLKNVLSAKLSVFQGNPCKCERKSCREEGSLKETHSQVPPSLGFGKKKKRS